MACVTARRSAFVSIRLLRMIIMIFMIITIRQRIEKRKPVYS